MLSSQNQTNSAPMTIEKMIDFPSLHDASSDDESKGGTPRHDQKIVYDDQVPVVPSRLSSPSPRGILNGEIASPGTAKKLGYEDAAPDRNERPEPQRTLVRRSSMKASTSDRNRSPKRGIGRHASMGCGSTRMVEVRVRGERFPVQRRRSIDFAKKVEVKEVVPITRLNEDHGEIWLQEDDFIKMKQERKTLVQKMRKGQAGDENTRGLEKYIDKSIRQAKHVAWDTVMMEQEEQEMAGEYDPNKLAEMYDKRRQWSVTCTCLILGVVNFLLILRSHVFIFLWFCDFVLCLTGIVFTRRNLQIRQLRVRNKMLMRSKIIS